MKRNYKLCTKCDRKISISNYKLHIKCCSGKLKLVTDEYKIDDFEYECPYCKKIYSKKGIATHVWRNHTYGKNHNPNVGYNQGIRTAWNKGLNLKIDNRVLENSKSLRKYYKTHENYWKGKHHTKETKEKLKNNGGYRKGSGHGKSGWYKGYWCDSSWELAYVIYNLDNNIKFIRNKKRFEYNFNNETHKYIPDYYIECDKIYVEIKGYINEKWESKKKQFPKKLKIIGKNEIKPILEYVKSKYGKDFISLYETKVH